MTGPKGSSSPTPLGGIVAACLTPFDVHGKVDFAAMERQIEFILPDADAISIGAVEAAEYTMLDLEARKELLRQGARMVAGRRPIVLGASSPRLRLVAELSTLAAEEGADFIQVLAPGRPWGGEPHPAELLEYFEEVQTVSPLPIVAYHNPRSGADPSIETWIRVCEMPGVMALKESSRDLTKIGLMINGIETPGHAAYLTTMQPLLATLLMGGSGAAMPPPGTRIGARVLAAVRDGDLEVARSWQRLFNVFPGRWAGYGLPPVMKSAMRHLGIDLGDPMPPFRPVSAGDHDQIGAFLSASAVIDEVEPRDRG